MTSFSTLRRPQLFIGSSTEALPIARAIKKGLAGHFDAVLWNDPVFRLSLTTLENLQNVVRQSAAAVMVFAPDDVLTFRGKRTLVARDNVLFELGLFMGYLPRERVFFLCPNTKKPFRVPPDLHGVHHGTYVPSLAARNKQKAVQPFCDQVVKAVAAQPRRILRGTLRARNLKAIGHGIPKRLDRTARYAFTDVTIAISGISVSVMAKVRMTGQTKIVGRLIGVGMYADGAAFIPYSFSDRHTGSSVRGTVYLRISEAGNVDGYWMSEDISDPREHRLAVGEVRLVAR